MGQGPSLSARVIGQSGGSTTQQLAVGNLPAHSHAVMASNKVANTTTITAAKPVGLATGFSDATALVTRYVAAGAGTLQDLDEQSISSATGGQQAHANLMPYQAINYIIALVGLYPTKD